MQLKKLAQRGLLDPEREDPFALFVASTPIRYCYYAEAQNVLGQTFSCAVLQVRRETENGCLFFARDRKAGVGAAAGVEEGGGEGGGGNPLARARNHHQKDG